MMQVKQLIFGGGGGSRTQQYHKAPSSCRLYVQTERIERTVRPAVVSNLGLNLALLLLAASAQASILITPDLHPDYAVQLPTDSTNLSGVIFRQLETSAPQNDFAFSGPLIGYFDYRNPARQIVWTTLRTPFVPTGQADFDAPPLSLGNCQVILNSSNPPAGSDAKNPANLLSPIVNAPAGADPEAPLATPEPGTAFVGLIALGLLVARRLL